MQRKLFQKIRFDYDLSIISPNLYSTAESKLISRETIYPLWESADMQTTHFTDASLNIVRTDQSNFRNHASTHALICYLTTIKAMHQKYRRKEKSRLEGWALLKTFLAKLAKCNVADSKRHRGTEAGGHLSETPGVLFKEGWQSQSGEGKSVEEC